MTDAERIWREKSDDDLLDAAAELHEFTQEGQQVIRAELKRRGLEDPVEQAGVEDEAEDEVDDEEPSLQCLRCGTTLRHIAQETDTLRWRWAGHHPPVYNPSGAIHSFACPKCGHVEMFMDLPNSEEATS